MERHEIDYEFELLNSEDGLTVTLVCRSSEPLCPEDFALALHEFADRIDILLSLNGGGNTVN